MENTSKWLSTLSGSLKPEVRLGLAISEFAQALDEDHKHDFRRMQNASNNQLTGSDVIKVTEQINKDGERRHSTWRPYGTRVHSFLSRLQMFASIGDVMIGGSQNLIATGVWSAVRLSLMAATNFLGYFERLSTLFMKLGTSWTLHKDYADLFTSSKVLQNHLCEYLIVLVRLCQKVVCFTQKGLTAQLRLSLGSSFDAEFGPIQKQMEERGSLIQQTAQHLATKSLLGSQNSRLQDLKDQTLQKLSPGQAHYVNIWRRQRRKGTCYWARETQEYKAWRASQESSTICIDGKLGSGKTVAMANIVAEINIEQPCAFFFCTIKEPDTLKSSNILGSIAFHLLSGLPHADKQIPWDALAGQDHALSGIWCPDDIVDMILRLAPRNRRYAILIDGLEDCLNADIEDVVLSLHRLVENRTILLCYSVRSESRFERRARRSLPADFCVSLDEANHNEEIHAYIKKEVRRLNASGYLSSELENLVKKQLILGSQGMYLWVSLQLNTIFPSDAQTVTTDEQILGLIENLPKGLPETFERALENITDKRYDGRIMKLILAAVSPLTLDELRVALTVTPGELIWRPVSLPHDGFQLISLCGGNLLELDEEDNRVRFIHHSVIQHLLSTATSPYTHPYHFSDRDAEQYIGSVCVTYLNLPCFERRLTVTKKIRGDDLTGKIRATMRQESGTALVGRLARYFKSRERAHPASTLFDIGRLASEIQATRLADHLDPLCFKDYAVHNWLLHTRFFNKEDKLYDQGDTALHYLALLRDTWQSKYVRLLLEHGADPNMVNNSGNTPLAIALSIHSSSGSTIHPLLRSGANLCGISVQDLNVRDWDGNTVLHYLATLPSAGTAIELLLYKGVSPNSRNYQGKTPVHAAAGAGEVATANLKILLDRGGNPNRRIFITGENSLYFAVSSCKATNESVRILLEAGVDPNDAPETYPRISLLQRAIMPSRDGYVNSEVIQLLLEAGADPRVPVSTGGTLEDLALQRGEQAVASLLSRY
ncbi:Vegetative incompatibility protein HET-E-1 [Cytospora mali]|uniref:Vegetative incompatibility protein HET-E-1 n=1 Tax=Cytospora mali TaxID=578113 RepID=A0A194VZI2_CYTMA|nr:Vegetative incompatibility protein HET-E-1 [Valsa mali]